MFEGQNIVVKVDRRYPKKRTLPKSIASKLVEAGVSTLKTKKLGKIISRIKEGLLNYGFHTPIFNRKGHCLEGPSKPVSTGDYPLTKLWFLSDPTEQCFAQLRR